MQDMTSEPPAIEGAPGASGPTSSPGFEDRPLLNISVVGAGISPADIPIGELAKLLRAASALLKAVADEKEHDAPDVAMVDVSPGSALYAFQASDPASDHTYGPIVERVHLAVASRGRDSSLAVRGALERLYSACGRGALQVSGRVSGRTLEAIVMAQPLRLVAPNIDATTILHGRVAGVDAKGEGFEVWLKPRDGSARLQLLTEDEGLAERAGGLFNQTARVTARYTLSPDSKRDAWELLGINPWEPTGLLSVLESIRAEITANGMSIDSERFRRTLGEDEREDA